MLTELFHRIDDLLERVYRDPESELAHIVQFHLMQEGLSLPYLRSMSAPGLHALAKAVLDFVYKRGDPTHELALLHAVGTIHALTQPPPPGAV